MRPAPERNLRGSQGVWHEASAPVGLTGGNRANRDAPQLSAKLTVRRSCDFSPPPITANAMCGSALRALGAPVQPSPRPIPLPLFPPVQKENPPEASSAGEGSAWITGSVARSRRPLCGKHGSRSRRRQGGAFFRADEIQRRAFLLSPYCGYESGGAGYLPVSPAAGVASGAGA